MQLLESSSEHRFALETPGLFVASFDGRCGSRHIHALRDCFVGQLARAHGGARPDARPFHVLVRVGNRATLSERGRTAVARLLDELTPHCVSWSIVIEGAGFWVASARTITSRILAMSGSACPIEVNETVEEGLAALRARGCAEAHPSLGRDVAALAILPTEDKPSTEALARRTEPAGEAMLAVVALEGHLTGGALEAQLVGLLTSARPVALLVDASRMRGYEQSARDAFVRWIVRHRPRLARVAIVTDNVLWRTVVFGMSAASGQPMGAFATRAEAERYLRGGTR